MKKFKVLAIGDIADNIFTLKKFTKRSEIHLITFPRKQDALLTNSEDDVEFFQSLLISKQVQKVREIKENYDLCLAMSWAGARIAYLAGLNYLMYFVGGDIATPPFVKNPRLSYLKDPAYRLNIVERGFYKKVFDSAICCVGGQVEYNLLVKYRKDAIRLDRVAVDTTLFNEMIEPVNLPKRKFTFLSAQRIGMEKGHDIIWKALRLCKSDFDVLQVKWFIETTDEEREFNKNLLNDMPPQVKLIPLIMRKDLGKYFAFADAIIGQMRVGTQGAIEREAAFCKKPVLCYTDPNMLMNMGDKKISPPFLPHNQDPIELAELIDRVVQSEEYRLKLAKEEYEYVKELSDPDLVIDEWENIFEKLITEHRTINRKSFPCRNKLENFVSRFLEKYYYSKTMRAKNIKAWGKNEYEQLTN